MKYYIEITDVYAREVLDSRGNPTVEVEVSTEDAIGRAIVPSGASTGEYEVCELRDGDRKRFGGKGVTKAVKNVNNIIADEIVGMNVLDQRLIDLTLKELDSTHNLHKLGANAVLGFSGSVNDNVATVFEQKLFDYMQNGRPLNVAVDLAKAESYSSFKEKYGYSNVDTARIYGKAELTLIPAGFGS